MENNNEKRGIDRAKLDTNADPAEDFFRFANGGWLDQNEIPPHLDRWGGLITLREQQQDKLRALLKDTVGEEAGSEDIRKLLDFYTTGMDEAARNRAGVDPITGYLEAAENISSVRMIPEAIASLHKVGAAPLWGVTALKDMKEKDRVRLYVSQGGLGMPDRDYYFDEDKRKHRREYHEMIRAIFALTGTAEDSAGRHADTVVRLEKRLAQKSQTRAELRDREAQYNKMTLSELEELTPALVPHWKEYCAAIGVDTGGLDALIVTQPDFLREVNTIFAEEPLEDITIYLQWHVLLAAAPHLSDEFYNAYFSFYGKCVQGLQKPRPQWQRVVGVLDALMGEALGRLYVDRYFSSEAKDHIHTLVDNLLGAARARIRRLEWMTEDTKKEALEKLDRIFKKLGYPDTWRDYSGLEISADEPYVTNVFRASTFEFDRVMAKIGKPVDRAEWRMTPPTVNAYYNPLLNEIVFPAGILQPPFFDVRQDDALNYARIGTVIGHELTHAFDDQGSTFDADGRLRNWWNREDRDNFIRRAKRLARQYEEHEVLPGLHLKGELTSGENIADFGGVNIAYEAFCNTLSERERGAKGEDGFTPEERFFVGYGQLWGIKVRQEALRNRVTTDPHAPPEFRVIVPLSNMEAFHKIFDVSEGDAMWRPPEERVKIW